MNYKLCGMEESIQFSDSILNPIYYMIYNYETRKLYLPDESELNKDYLEYKLSIVKLIRNNKGIYNILDMSKINYSSIVDKVSGSYYLTMNDLKLVDGSIDVSKYESYFN